MLADYAQANYTDEDSKQSRQQSFYSEAKIWYDIFVNDFQQYANTDNVFSRYADLLYLGGELPQALIFYERAAFDNGLLLDKDAAYASINTANQLITESQDPVIITKFIEYSKKYIEAYPEDEKSLTIAINASQKAFKEKRFTDAVSLARNTFAQEQTQHRFELNNIIARSLMAQSNYVDAEIEFQNLLKLTQKNKGFNAIQKSLELSVFRQAEQAKSENRYDQALYHYSRLADSYPKSELAPLALLDAIALSTHEKNWQPAAAFSELFIERYPSHPRVSEVNKSLSVAYLQSNKTEKAADTLISIAQFEQDLETKRTAIWQAATLYEQKGKIKNAIHTYRDYAHQYKQPYAQNLEAMLKLTELYNKTNDHDKKRFWQNKIVQSDRSSSDSLKTERTLYIAASANFALAKWDQGRFNRTALKIPLAKSLKRKKSLMLKATEQFGRAANYGFDDLTTESTYSIAKIYLAFSQALLNSERPRNLSDDELLQYDILLEDQAFPFEEKAIEFFETNMARTKESISTPWTTKSLTELKTLFPVRYAREMKISLTN